MTERARVTAAKSALVQGDLAKAESVASRQVISPSEGYQVVVRFISPPDWERYGEALWNVETGETHSVFHKSTMLVNGVAVPGCVGLPFKDEAARRDCAKWCLRNGLEKLAKRAARTPVCGDRPYCTWPKGNIVQDQPDTPLPFSDRAGHNVEDKHKTHQTVSEAVAPEAQKTELPSNDLFNLFGGVY